MFHHMPHLLLHTHGASPQVTERVHHPSQGIHNSSDSVPKMIHILMRSLEHFKFRVSKEKDTLVPRC